jgi:hypothetical protein
VRRPKPPTTRQRVPQTRRQKAKELEGALAALQEQFPDDELSDIIQTAILSARNIAESSNAKDRDLVFRTLEHWDRLTMAELLEETGLSRWVLHSYLNEFAGTGLIRIDEERIGKRERGKPRLIYSIVHTSGRL